MELGKAHKRYNAASTGERQGRERGEGSERRALGRPEQRSEACTTMDALSDPLRVEGTPRND